MSLIDSDERVRREHATLRQRPHLDLRTFRRDVFALMESIPVVRVGYDRVKMEDARIELARKRTRLAYIKAQCILEHGMLTRAQTTLEDYLYGTYGSTFKSAGNDRLRAGLTSRALAPFAQRLSPIKAMLDIVDVAMADYDSRAFGFRDVVAAMKLGDRGE